MNDRDDQLGAIRETYAGYRREGRDRLWDLGNRGYARLVRDRDRALVGLLRRSARAGTRIIDVGCGTGDLAGVARRAGVPFASWTGVDLDPAAVQRARDAIPWATFAEASADRLPFKPAEFNVAIASTLFSSLPSPELEASVAAEIARVLDSDGQLIWYDLRYDNPRNRAVHGITANRLAELFPTWDAELRPLTLIPPLARRLAWLTPVAYPLLHALPVLRSHLVGRLARRPSQAGSSS